MGGIPPFISAIHGQIRRLPWANLCRGRFHKMHCYFGAMELLLIIAGGILSTAIIFMMIEWARGDVMSDDEFDHFDHPRYDDPMGRDAKD